MDYGLFIIESFNMGVDNKKHPDFKKLFNSIIEDRRKFKEVYESRGIYFYQEVPKQYKKQIIDSDRGIYNESASIIVEDGIYKPDVQEKGCALMWTSNFILKKTVDPSYWNSFKNKDYNHYNEKDSLFKKVSANTGIRSTSWVILQDNFSKEMYACISLHLPVSKSVNNNVPVRRKIILRGILNDAKHLKEKYGCLPIIGGDFNTKPDELKNLTIDSSGKNHIIDNGLVFAETKKQLSDTITVINNLTNFKERIDYFILDHKINHSREFVHGIDNSKSKYEKKHISEFEKIGYDHAMIKVAIIPLL